MDVIERLRTQGNNLNAKSFPNAGDLLIEAADEIVKLQEKVVTLGDRMQANLAEFEESLEAGYDEAWQIVDGLRGKLKERDEQIQKLRDELTAQIAAGCQAAFQTIMEMKRKLEEQKIDYSGVLDKEYFEALEAIEERKPLVIGWAIQDISKKDGTSVYSLYSNNSPHVWTEDGGCKDVTAEEYVKLEVEYRLKRFKGLCEYRIFPIEV